MLSYTVHICIFRSGRQVIFMYLCDDFVHHVRPHSITHFVWFGYFDGDCILVLWLRRLAKTKTQQNNFYALKTNNTIIKNTQERLKKPKKLWVRINLQATLVLYVWLTRGVTFTYISAFSTRHFGLHRRGTLGNRKFRGFLFDGGSDDWLWCCHRFGIFKNVILLISLFLFWFLFWS